MRLWSLHPGYLDAKGLVAVWREGLLAQAVLAGKTRGYRSHPQLARFLAAPEPLGAIAAYLREVLAEAGRRGYRFDPEKPGPGGSGQLAVTAGQLAYEWRHLTLKLQVRDPEWLKRFDPAAELEPHPLFRVVEGGVEDWEAVRKAPGLATAPIAALR